MNFFARRPAALCAAIALVISLVSAYLGAVGRIALLIGITVVSVGATIYFRRKPEHKVAELDGYIFSILAGIMSVMLLFTSIALYDFNVGKCEKYAAESSEHDIRAIIVDVKTETDWYTSYEISLKAIDGKGSFESGLMICEGEYGHQIGDELVCKVNFVSLDELYANYGMDKYDLIVKGTHFSCRPTESVNKVKESVTLQTLISKLRKEIGAAVSIFCDSKTAAIVKALLLSERDELGILRRDMSRSGVSHLLALSGMHLSVICGMIDLLANKFKIHKYVRMTLQIIGAVIMLVLSAFTYSLLRAAVMLILLNISRMTFHDRDPLTALFLSAWIIAFIDPSSLVDVGFEMSFAATLGVLLSVNAERPIRIKLRKITKKNVKVALVRDMCFSVITCIGAMFGVFMLQWLHFGEISLFSLPATIIFSPIFSAMLWLIVPYAAASLLNMGRLATVIGGLIAPLADLTRAISSAMSKCHAVISLRYRFVPIFVILFIIAVIIIRKHKNIGYIKVLGIFTVFAVAYVGTVGIYDSYRKGNNELYFVNYKTNDAALIYSGGRCMLIDISSGSSPMMNCVSEKMNISCMTEIDTLMLTHLHRSHAVMLTQLCSNMLVRRVLIPVPSSEYEIAASYAVNEAAQKVGAVVEYYPSENALIEYENISIGLPYIGKLKRSTHELIGIYFDLGARNIFYSGSSVWETEYDINADTIVVGTHGPKVKTDPSFDVPEILPIYDAKFNVRMKK